MPSANQPQITTYLGSIATSTLNYCCLLKKEEAEAQCKSFWIFLLLMMFLNIEIVIVMVVMTLKLSSYKNCEAEKFLDVHTVR